MKELRVIIAGGRDFNDYNLLYNSVMNIITTHINSVVIVSGMARGADRLGVQFANENKLKIVCFPAKWNELGKCAGYIRNVEMAKFASMDNNEGMLIAFWDGKSKGTKHMIDTARKYKLKVFIIDYNNENNT